MDIKEEIQKIRQQILDLKEDKDFKALGLTIGDFEVNTSTFSSKKILVSDLFYAKSTYSIEELRKIIDNVILDYDPKSTYIGGSGGTCEIYTNIIQTDQDVIERLERNLKNIKQSIVNRKKQITEDYEKLKSLL